MSPASGRPSNIQEVADVAGVSASTVSRVLNGNPSVDAELAIRVRQAITASGYRPSRVARSLRRSTSETWGLIIPDVGNTFYTSMVRGVEDVAHGLGISIYLCNSDDDLDKERRYLAVALSENVAGIVLAPASEAESDLGAVRAAGIPVVTVDRRVQDEDVSSVVVDNVDAAAAATQLLLRNGYRRLACIVGPRATTTSREREQGYLRALAQGLGPTANAMVLNTNFRYDGGWSAVGELAALAEPPDAVLLGNDAVAMGALERMRNEPRALPGPVGLVAFDDAPWYRLIKPSLSAVVQPTYEIGRVAGELMRALMTGSPDPATHHRLITRLVERESSLRSDRDFPVGRSAARSRNSQVQ